MKAVKKILSEAHGLLHHILHPLRTLAPLALLIQELLPILLPQRLRDELLLRAPRPHHRIKLLQPGHDPRLVRIRVHDLPLVRLLRIERPQPARHGEEQPLLGDVLARAHAPAGAERVQGLGARADAVVGQLARGLELAGPAVGVEGERVGVEGRVAVDAVGVEDERRAGGDDVLAPGDGLGGGVEDAEGDGGEPAVGSAGC